MANTKLLVQNSRVTVTRINDSDFISLTDIARIKNPDEPKDVVKNWMRSRSTIEYIGLWEKINNPDFKGVEFDTLRAGAGLNSFTLSPNKWQELTAAIGIKSTAGRNGGTYAHKDIAFEFASWVRQGLTQPDRLQILNNTAIAQMQSLLANPAVKK